MFIFSRAIISVTCCCLIVLPDSLFYCYAVLGRIEWWWRWWRTW